MSAGIAVTALMSKRILITGSRNWDDRAAVHRAFHALCEEHDLNYPPDKYGNTMPDPCKITVVHGACPTGADAIVDDWCLGNLFAAERHPAEWGKYGRRAGPIRNAMMVELGADICLAFIRDASPGATHTASLAESRGIPVIRIPHIHRVNE